MTLLLVPDNEVKMTLGCSGGGYRSQQYALFITNIVEYSMTLEEAIGFPRFMLSADDTLLLEKCFKNLHALDRQIRLLDYPGPTGVAHGVEVLDEGKKEVCDVRRDGIPMGF